MLNGRLTIERRILAQIVDEVKTVGSRKEMQADAGILAVRKRWKQASQFSAESNWIFASPVKLGRQPYCDSGFWRVLQKAGEEAGIGHLGTHSFRHTYRSWLQLLGTPIAVQQKAMRHADIGTTLNIHGDVFDEELGQAHGKVVALALTGKAN